MICMSSFLPLLKGEILGNQDVGGPYHRTAVSPVWVVVAVWERLAIRIAPRGGASKTYGGHIRRAFVSRSSAFC